MEETQGAQGSPRGVRGRRDARGLPHGYHSGQRVLLVGEGNLSFALALSTLFDGEGANILATSLDRPGVARAAYPDLRDIEESLEASGAAVRFGVDVEDGDALRKAAKGWWAAGNDPSARARGTRAAAAAAAAPSPARPRAPVPAGSSKGSTAWRGTSPAGVGAVGKTDRRAGEPGPA